MSVKISISEGTIKAKIDNQWNSALEMISGEILKDCNEFCKEETGMLIMSSLIHSDLKNGKLIWSTPYAARQYYEIRTAYKHVNGKATWRWVDVAKRLYKGEWARKAQAIIRRYGA